MDWASQCTVVGKNENVVTLGCLIPLLKNLIIALLIFAGAAAVIFFIFIGIRLVVSGGDAKQVEGARSAFFTTLIGLIVVFLAFAIISLIATVTNVKCIQLFGFDNCLQTSQGGSGGLHLR